MFRQFLTAILFLAVLGGFLGLGLWQLNRLEWKQGILAEIEEKIGAEPGALPEAPDREADRYRPVTVTGHFEDGELDVLVSTRDFGPGFRIIAPFVTEDGRRILVDRGYVRSEMRDAPRGFGTAEITGNLHWPDERSGSTPDDDPEGNWWYARDVEKMAAYLGTEPILLIASSPTDPGILPLPVTTEGIRNKHFEYAMTWFLFAAVWVVMTAAALWRIRRRNSRGLPQ